MSDETTSTPEVREGQRIAKVMARAGLCSRRDAENWIAAGRVTVNGKVLDSPAFNVSEADDVRVDGQRLAARERTRLFLFHKPRGLVTTARDPEGRPTIFDALPPDLPRLVAVGRLDINSEGLILLTNDGGVARVLELPATGWLRRYRVRAHGRIDQARLDSLSEGVTVDGVDYAGIEARLDREQGSNTWITMGLREGKNREIKKVLEHLGLAVNRLIRVSFGPFELGDLAEGEVAEVRTRVLRDQLGAKLAREAGADFDAPIVERSSEEADRNDEPQRRASPRQNAPRRDLSPDRAHGSRDRSSEDGRAKARGAAPRRGPPPPSQPERRRKHVSALRAEIADGAAGPRKRIERSATHDRKGRTIAVERISVTGEEARKRKAEITPKVEGKVGPARGQRRARRSEAERETGERPRRPNSSYLKRARDGEGRDRPLRADQKGGGRRPGFAEHGPRRGPPKDRASEGRTARERLDRPDARGAKRGSGTGPPADRSGRAPKDRRPTREAVRRDPSVDQPQRERGPAPHGGAGAGRSSSGGPKRSQRKGPPRGHGGGSRRPPRKS